MSTDDNAAVPPHTRVRLGGSVKAAIIGIFLISLISALYFSRDFILPIIVAFILALTLSPVVRFFNRVMHIPNIISAISIVLTLTAGVIFMVYALSAPMTDWIDRAPQIGAQLEEKLSFLRKPLQSVMDAEKEVVDATSNPKTTKQAVVVEGPGIVKAAASNVLFGLTNLVIVMVLLVFLLASGDMFYAKLVQAFDTMSDKKRALRVAHGIERVISRYLFTVTIINLTLGAVIGAGLFVLGMPTPYIWGIFAALLNFIPYAGALIGLGAITMAAIVSFDTLSQALAVSAFYFACTTLEGQFITPFVVGRRLELNAVAVFITVGFWAWLWGIVGALIAVPLLMIFQTICIHAEVLPSVSNFLRAEDAPVAPT